MPYFIGTIASFGINYCPEGWLPCMGQVAQIGQYTELYSLIWTRFGGDGRVTFGIPDLRGRVPMGYGQGPGLTWRTMGNMPGVEHLPLSNGQMPIHSHPGSLDGVETKLHCAAGDGNQDDPIGHSIAKVTGTNQFTDAVPDQPMKTGTVHVSGDVEIGDTGSGQYHENCQPYTVFNYCICWDGTYPRRP